MTDADALQAARDEGWASAMGAVQREPLWLLRGDLDWLEVAMADYIAKWGTNWTGRPYDGSIAGMPCAVANMAMTVIRKNIRRVEGQKGLCTVPMDTAPSDPDQSYREAVTADDPNRNEGPIG